YLTRVSDAAGGIHVRLSSTDPRIVDIKFFDSRGLDIDKDAERKIENTFFREDYRRVYLDEVGSIHEVPQLVDRYVHGFMEQLNVEEFRKSEFNRKIVIDFSHASTAAVLPPILNQLGLEPVGLNASIDETKLARDVGETGRLLRELAAITGTLRAGLGVMLDPGGERMRVVDDTGAILDNFQVLAAATELVLRDQPGKDVCVPVSAPNVFDEIAARHSGRVLRTRVNPAAIMTAASQRNVVIAGDGNGGLIFPQFHPAFDAMFSIVRLIELLARHRTRLSEVVRSLPEFHLASGQVSCPWESKGKVMRLLAERFRDRRVRQIDGVKITIGREWVLVLPDADRPLFHVIAESSSREGANALLAKYTALVSGLQH
ncbi:MAG: nucleotidyl transferase, partial [Thermomicrobiales bacterium]|nr:nucleotidyl transferase [Thermomicrobiales bacterium]